MKAEITDFGTMIFTPDSPEDSEKLDNFLNRGMGYRHPSMSGREWTLQKESEGSGLDAQVVKMTVSLSSKDYQSEYTPGEC
jgi:hypothetical protein